MKDCKVFSIVFGLVILAGDVRAQPPTMTPIQNPDWLLPLGLGMDMGPCEELGNPTLGKDKRITINVNQRERELIHLALEGFKADMEHELAGVGGWTRSVLPELFGGTGKPGPGPASPPFHARAFFLNYFINVVVPSMQQRVYGEDLISDFNLEMFGGPVATEKELRKNFQEITFTACERSGLSIATEKWSDRPDGQMGRHVRICKTSKEMAATSACGSFTPLARAYKSLRKKIEKDQ